MGARGYIGAIHMVDAGKSPAIMASAARAVMKGRVQRTNE